MLTIFGYSPRPQPKWESNPPSGGPAPEPPAPAPQPQPKLVPESDLLAVKSKAERDVNALRQQIDTMQREGAATKAQLEDLQSQLTAATATAQEVEQLRSQAAAAEESRNRLNDRLTTSLRADLVSKYGYKEDDVKGYSLEQLELLTESLGKLPGAGQPARGQPRFNSGTNGGGGTVPTSARGKVLAGFESGEVRRVRGGNQNQ